MVRETMEARITVRTAAGEMKMSRIEAVLHKIIEQAMKGNQRAQSQLISVYRAAVPEPEPGPEMMPVARTEELTDAEKAENEAFFAEFMH